jgi:hypothetical protein
MPMMLLMCFCRSAKHNYSINMFIIKNAFIIFSDFFIKGCVAKSKTCQEHSRDWPSSPPG